MARFQHVPTATDHQDPKPTLSEADVPAPSEGNEPAPSAANGEEACPEPSEAAADSAPRQPKPKRKYNVSDKVRASAPANLKQARKKYVFTPARRAAAMKALEKANAAPPAKRNRRTEKRWLASYANLCLAYLKQGPPGHRAPAHIRHGVTCRRLEHSLKITGEDKQKLQSHRDRFRGAFRPRDGKERKLVAGMADAAWRLLRVFGSRARWELRAVQYRLKLAIAQRPAEGGWGVGDASRVVVKLLHDLAGFASLFEQRRQLQKRLELLARAFLTHRRGGPSSLHFFTSAGARVPDFERLPDFALGNPGLSPAEAERLAQQEAEGLKDLKPLEEWAVQAEDPEAGETEAREAEAGGTEAEAGNEEDGLQWLRDIVAILSEKVVLGDAEEEENSEGKFLRYKLLGTSGYDDSLDKPGLERLLAPAFGIEAETGNSKFETRNSKIETGEDETRDSQPETTSDRRVSNFEFRVSPSEQSSIQAVADTLWERLSLFPRQEEAEDREMAAELERAAGPQGVETWEPRSPWGVERGYKLEAEDRTPHWQWRALAALMLAVFAGYAAVLHKAGDSGAELQRALYAYLFGRYGEHRAFSFLRPDLARKRSKVSGLDDLGMMLRECYAWGVPPAIATPLRL